jgi:hypothetical protein
LLTRICYRWKKELIFIAFTRRRCRSFTWPLSSSIVWTVWVHSHCGTESIEQNQDSSESLHSSTSKMTQNLLL